MTHEDSPLLEEYIWKSTAIIGGVYLFFLTERFLKMIMNFRRVSIIPKIHENLSSAPLKNLILSSATLLHVVFRIFHSYLQKRRHEKKPSDILSSIHTTRHRHESMNMSFEPHQRIFSSLKEETFSRVNQETVKTRIIVRWLR